MRYFFLLILTISSLSWLPGQTIKIKVRGLNQPRVQLSYLRSGNFVLLDSILTDKNMINYTYAKNSGHPGFYRINISKSSWIDFIIDDEDISLSTDVKNLTDSMTVISSESNKLYYEYINLNKHFKIIKGKLQVIVSEYSQKYLHFVNITSQKNNKTFIARYIKTTQLPIENVNLTDNQQVAYQKIHYLDNINFDDDDLLYSDAFTTLSLRYITLFRNTLIADDLIEKELKSAVDNVLNKAKINLLVYQDITQILIDKFRHLGFNSVIDYIVDDYVIKDDLCLDENLPGSIQQRIDQSKSFKTGIKVPDIILPDSTGQMIDLYNINSKNTLILFYASWCPHCQRLLPRINEVYKNQKEIKVKILAVSLDTNRTEWLNFVRTNNYKWINVSDLKGGYGKDVKAYKIYATPSMFLVNDKKELIGIPANFEDLIKLF
ncbi:MAG: TlpA disulfide reductase family protein [Ignavibacteriaceae bacterium]|nr:TlpA disulfide reductase family protein [Ignavibacteriaceae bacterium]